MISANEFQLTTSVGLARAEGLEPCRTDFFFGHNQGPQEVLSKNRHLHDSINCTTDCRTWFYIISQLLIVTSMSWVYNLFQRVDHDKKDTYTV